MKIESGIYTKRTVPSVSAVLTDVLFNSNKTLIATGYSSFYKICEFICQYQKTHTHNKWKLRILLGTYLSDLESLKYKVSSKKQEIEYYNDCIRQGFSFNNAISLLKTVISIESGCVDIRIHPKNCHVKLYVTKKYSAQGSANFSNTGFYLNEESISVDLASSKNGGDISDYAEELWGEGFDFSGEFLSLISEMIKPCDFDEAVAQACVDVLSGDYIRDYIAHNNLQMNLNVPWVHQVAGAAQAFDLILRYGFVMFSDTPGVGKTKQGTLLLKLIDLYLGLNSGSVLKKSVICPPLLREKWKNECSEYRLDPEIWSSGLLSRCSKSTAEIIDRDLCSSKIILVDELQNFINQNTKRRHRISISQSDYFIGISATPINNSVDDILSILGMLDFDALNDDDQEYLVGAFIRLKKIKKEKICEGDLSSKVLVDLSKFLDNFIVRRTPKQLEYIISMKPESYRRYEGGMWGYPDYDLNTCNIDYPYTVKMLLCLVDTTVGAMTCIGSFILNNDVGILDIYLDALEDNLLFYYRQALKKEIKSKIFGHSGGAMEYLFGYDEEFGSRYIDGCHKETIGKIDEWSIKLERIKGDISKNEYKELKQMLEKDISNLSGLRKWLLDYGKILDKKRLNALKKIVKNHRVIVIYNRNPLCLTYLYKDLEEINIKHNINLITGSTVDKNDIVNLLNANVSKQIPPTIVLTTFVLSEGCDLHNASALVHIGIPRGLGRYEQTSYRIIRFDSPYSKVNIYILKSDEFTLSAEKGLTKTSSLAGRIFGSNLDIPGEFRKRWAQDELYDLGDSDHKRKAKNSISFFDKSQDSYAYQPIIDLIENYPGGGRTARCNLQTFEKIFKQKGKLKPICTVIRSRNNWQLIAYRDTRLGIPRWILFGNEREKILDSFGDIAASLYQRTSSRPVSLGICDDDMDILEKRMLQIQNSPPLSAKNKRLIEQITVVLGHLISESVNTKELCVLDEFYQKLVSSSDYELIDQEWLANCWRMETGFVYRHISTRTNVSGTPFVTRIQPATEYMLNDDPDVYCQIILNLNENLRFRERPQLISAVIARRSNPSQSHAMI